ncbi:MAG: acetyltransferase [Anaerolineales bacterium]|nr:acetyltransferase [Anaerolineales bacterium]
MKILLIGASEHAKVVMDIIEREGKYKIRGLIDTYKPAGGDVFGYKILGAEDALVTLFKSGEATGGIITIGDNWTRHLVAEKIKTLAPELNFVTAVHPSASIARGVEIGAGSVLMAGVVVNSDSKIGAHCILNTRSALDHDCAMDDFSSLAPGATIGGKVSIGAFSAISLGANIIHGITIGEQTVLGAGAVALKNIPDHCVAYGVPARVIRKRAAGERYL